MDKYSAVWVSHSSIADFLRCPQLYFLRNVYKDPLTGHKITRMEPPLALGQIVHDVVESLSVLPSEDRLKISLIKKFETEWENVSGKMGGFSTKQQEEEYKNEGRKMLQRVMDNPGPILNKAIKIKQELPHYYLSEEDNIILCGKIDWLEYLEETDSVHVIDFKTGKNEEKADSLQLPIYQLLIKNTQSRDLTKASYWYLRTSDSPKEVPLPDLAESHEKVLSIAKRVKLARQLERYVCPHGGCKYCIPLLHIKEGKGELVGTSSYNQDIYII
jgi:ATP-dependent helicase/DNAse subunit B